VSEKHSYTNPSKPQDLAHLEAGSDKKYDADGNELDKHGFKVKVYPDALETVRKSLENCEQLCGLDKNTVAELLKGEFNQYATLNSTGRMSKKIVIEYDIKQKKEDE
tara:strand:+ start:52 stop:372 length:321 start_codon:yes stop_codon:yes gene_type:complete